MAEETIFRTMELPEGTDWAWYPDLNVVALSSRLNCADRISAIYELQQHWRRQHLRLVESV